MVGAIPVVGVPDRKDSRRFELQNPALLPGALRQGIASVVSGRCSLLGRAVRIAPAVACRIIGGV